MMSKTENPIAEKDNSNCFCVLVVDDLRVNFLLIKAMLSRFRAEVFWSPDGFDAIEQIQHGKAYNLLLLDYNMPGIDGLETAKRIKKLKPDLPIVSMSTFTENPAFDRKNAPFDAYLSKPVDPEILYSLIFNKLPVLKAEYL
ncbi:MAG TPA: response regulator [Bacteroidales bacterium]|nr:response regulator [Bacteroidales bacterium]